MQQHLEPPAEIGLSLDQFIAVKGLEAQQRIQALVRLGIQLVEIAELLQQAAHDQRRIALLVLKGVVVENLVGQVAQAFVDQFGMIGDARHHLLQQA